MPKLLSWRGWNLCRNCCRRAAMEVGVNVEIVVAPMEVSSQLLQSMRSCQVGLNSVHFKTLKTAKIVLTFLLISQE